MTEDGTWHIWVDTGGTFTDCLARNPEGRIERFKTLSSGRLRARLVAQQGRQVQLQLNTPIPPGFLHGAVMIRGKGQVILANLHQDEDQVEACEMEEPLKAPLTPGEVVEIDFNEEAPILAAHLATRCRPGETLPSICFHLATTKSTNALLERKGHRTAFLVTRGFGDLLSIGDQRRPDLFALEIRKPKPLYDQVWELDERLDATGKVLKPLNPRSVRLVAQACRKEGIQTIAIALLHAYRNPVHEDLVASIFREEGFAHVSCSSRLAPFVKYLPRAETCVVNAYLAPMMTQYLGRIEHRLREKALKVMTSAGGYLGSQQYQAKDSLFSGPAGGLVGTATHAHQCRQLKTIAFDMGGTSTDVARYDGRLDYQFEQSICGVRLMAPSLKIETVAAGGGSICNYVEGIFAVGPESAGASPGPASYGAGGPLTLTDVNVLLGRMDPSLLGIPFTPEAAHEAALALLRKARADQHPELTLESMLEGFRNMANERMAEAIAGISVREGYNPKDYTLTAFGGAGGQHACGVADRLQMNRILFPAQAGLLSAFGLMHARTERFSERQVLQSWKDIHSEFPRWMEVMEEEARLSMIGEGFEPDQIEISRRLLEVRLPGQETCETLDWSRDQDPVEHFLRRYREIYGYTPNSKDFELVSLRVIASSKPPPAELETFEEERPLASQNHVRCHLEGVPCEIPVWDRRHLRSGDWVSGPAIIQDSFSTLMVDRGWKAVTGSMGSQYLTRNPLRTDLQVPSERLQEEAPFQLELFTHRFFSLVEEMGLMLQRTSLSTNVKERLDFSCALLDAQGRLVANAPHIPVHLGAMGICVRKVMETMDLQPGDMVITNHPGFGGSHLPDLTVIFPVHDEEKGLLGFVANRAHHAELGGIRPGSMPPDATNLEEEGVVIPPMWIYRQGEPCLDAIRDHLTSGPYPTRSISDNMADLQAQVAANLRGANALKVLARQCGPSMIRQQMCRLLERSARLISERLSRFKLGTYAATEALDDGSRLAVTITLDSNGCCFDFEGTSGVHPGNLNATPAIVRSVVLYVLRCLLKENIPLNEGLLQSIKILLPPGMLHPPFDQAPEACPPVVGGNVETSQRLVDVLFKALGVAACSQGTMNNVIFGNDHFSYYETVCGGSGATSTAPGCDAVHTHMTNTAITDPEILEVRYPVRLHTFAIRRNSGGKGLHPGGCGIRRELEFLEAVSLSLITQHRSTGPYGIGGGEAGTPGSQWLIHRDGSKEPLPSIGGRQLQEGQRLVLETPGGGAYGRT